MQANSQPNPVVQGGEGCKSDIILFQTVYQFIQLRLTRIQYLYT